MAFGKFRALKINLPIYRLYPKKAVIMLYINWLNEATSGIFLPTANLENFEIHL